MNEPYARLAFREEGSLWVAYLAAPGNMENALYLGSIRLMFVEDHPDRKRAFMELMKAGLADATQELFGTKPSGWSEEPAPEHERGGNG